MKENITQKLVDEHKLIIRMLALLEHNANLASQGKIKEYVFFLDAVDFVRNYADKFHHAKEEDILFEAMLKNGMPKNNSPVAAMLMEHEQGRGYVKAMEEAAQRALAGEPNQDLLIAENAIGYTVLLREHIEKEDTILYPLAERIVADEQRDVILKSYSEAENKVMSDFVNKYEKLVENYEIKMRQEK